MRIHSRLPQPAVRTEFIVLLLGTAYLFLPAVRGAGLRVDFNLSGRHVSETLEPEFVPWATSDNWLPPGANTISNTFGTVTFTFTRVGRLGTGLVTDWWRGGVLEATNKTKLVSDGVTVKDGTGGAQVEMRISGLSAGTHTLLTYHNTWANPATHTFSALNIYVDGMQVVTNLPVSNRVTNNADAAFACLQFDVIAGRDVVVLFEADTSDPEITDRNVCIDGFEIDVPAEVHKGIQPVVVDRSKPDAVRKRQVNSESDNSRFLPGVRNPKELTTIVECLADARNREGTLSPLRIEATVTLVDKERGMFVLQDGSAAMMVDMSLTNLSLQSGQKLLLEGARVLPYFRSFPDYPDRPAGHDYLSSFEAPTNTGNYYLARMRGWLCPPVTGKYVFWIAADDGAVLWLSPDENPDKARKVSSLTQENPAGFREWNRHGSQQSQEIELQAGERYYIEAMQMHAVGPDWMAVAWARPGLTQSVIGGKYLSPWPETITGAAPGVTTVTTTNGLLREYWTNFYVRDFNVLRNRSPSESTVRIQSPRLTVLGIGELPTPRRINPAESPGVTANLQWVEIEGTVNFSAAMGSKLQFELVGERSNVKVQVFNWNGGSAARLENSRVRVRGVWERVNSVQRNIYGGGLRVPDGRQLTVLPPAEDGDVDQDAILISEIEPSNPAMTWGRRIKVRGRVAAKESPTSLLLQGDDIFQGYCSSDGTNWSRLGTPVEVGMSNSVLVGLAVASHQSVNPATATFDRVSGSGTNWLSAEIYGRQTGEYKINGSTYILRGSGRQIAQAVDHFYFLYRSLEGEGEIEARLNRLASADPLAQAGLMIRESLDRKAVYAAVLSTPEGAAKFQCRRTFGEFPAEFVPQTGKSWLKVVRRKNGVRVRSDQPLEVQRGEETTITGTLVWENGAPVLEEASCFVIAGENIHSPDPDRILRSITIEELLSRTQRPSQPYHRGYLEVSGLRGVVTFCDRVMNRNMLFIQDGASGIPLFWADTNLTVPLQVGQQVRVSGRTTVGQTPVALEAETLTVMGSGTLPEAVRYSAGHFTSQSRHGQWVEVEGVVRAAGRNGGLNIMGKEGMLAAWLGHSQPADQKQYVNTRVKARGVLSLIPGNDPRLLIPSPEFLEVREPTPADPFAIPTFSVATLAGLSIRPEELRQMKISGVVTGLRAKELFVQDDSGGACVRALEEPAVKPGDQVEVVGFPGGFPSAVLSEALIRKTGVGTLPTPILITTGEKDEKKYAGVLVRLEAMVLDQRDGREGQRLSLQAGAKVFEAELATAAGEIGRVPAIPIGSRVAVTGVCQVNHSDGIYRDEGRAAALVTPLAIWLRTPADVVLLQRPPWWTWKHTVVIVCLFAGGLLAALIWVRTLRRRVRQRTRELQETASRLEKEIHTSAVLAERDRLAGEIHDSVEQGLTAIMLQLDAADKQADNPDAARRCLKLARSMAGFSRGEVQHAVWDLQSPLLENADLGAALTHVANEISSGTSPQVTVNIVGEFHQLPSSVEHHLLRIGQEAITNGVKHAQAKTIQVTLEYSRQELRLSVKDDGVGFVPDAVSMAGQSGHFGLQGIRMRANKINAALTVSSQPGRGTAITVTTALDGDGAGAGATEKAGP